MSNNDYKSKVSEMGAFEILMDIHHKTMKASPEPYECYIGERKFQFTAEDAKIQNKEGEWVQCKLEHKDGELIAEVDLNDEF